MSGLEEEVIKSVINGNGSAVPLGAIVLWLVLRVRKLENTVVKLVTIVDERLPKRPTRN